jgi:hypothetical protein
MAVSTPEEAQIRWGLEYIRNTYGPGGTGAYWGTDLSGDSGNPASADYIFVTGA